MWCHCELRTATVVKVSRGIEPHSSSFFFLPLPPFLGMALCRRREWGLGGRRLNEALDQAQAAAV